MTEAAGAGERLAASSKDVVALGAALGSAMVVTGSACNVGCAEATAVGFAATEGDGHSACARWGSDDETSVAAVCCTTAIQILQRWQTDEEPVTIL